MDKELIAQKDPKSPISEVFRTLRTNIQFMNTNKNLKTLLITSCVSGDGKSLVASNLAATFAQAGKRVILIDCDMRKGRQHNIFDIASRPGLSNFLSGISSNGGESGQDLSDYIKETEVPNLFLIPAGNIPPNPSELLASEAMMNLLEKLKNVCDIVILDGTPSYIVTDAVILSRFVDSTIIVVSHNKTKMEELQKVKRDIDNVGGKIAGVVINRIELNAKKYKDRYYYYGHNPNLPEKKVSRRNQKANDAPRRRKETTAKKASAKEQNEDSTQDDLSRTQDILNSLDTYLQSEKIKDGKEKE